MRLTGTARRGAALGTGDLRAEWEWIVAELLQDR